LRRTASLTAVLWAFQYQMSMDGLAIQHRGARFRKPLSRKSSLRFDQVLKVWHAIQREL
jgi:hypothetical protein